MLLRHPLGHAREQPIETPPGPQGNRPLDILFVVDNSGSMAEEQAALARTIYKSECPIADLNAVPEALLDPKPGLLERLKTVCGFSQILAAYDRDFRVGVITTDVDACDNFIPQVMGGDAWGFRPQRGCLQPTADGQKVLTRDDVDLANKFREIVTGLGTFGSPYERGFDAVDDFLVGDTFSDSCAGDRDAFLRDGAQLLVVFVSDEDDCSHADDTLGFDDETLHTCGADLSSVTPPHNPSECYAPGAHLVPVADFAQHLADVKGADVSVAVIAGAVDSGAELVASGCRPGGASTPQTPDSACHLSEGASNATGPGEPCDPVTLGGEQCCTADPAKRYLELRDDVASFTGGSICNDDMIDALIEATQKTESDG